MPIPPALKTSPSIGDSAKKQIQTAVQADVAKLADADPEVGKAARDRLVEAGRSVGTPISESYAMEYATAVNAELLLLLDRAQAIRPRLNAAIVAARVADGCQNAQLEPVVLKLLAANQPEVIQLWGVKAVRGILPELIRKGKHQKMLDMVVSVGKAKLANGAVVTDAYAAMARSKNPAVVAVVADPMLSLLQARIDHYKAMFPKKTFVEDMAAEVIPIDYLTQNGVWNHPTALGEARQIKVMQAIVDVLVLTARRGDAVAEDRDDVTPVIDRVCQCVSVVGNLRNDKTLEMLGTVAYRNVRTAKSLLELVTPIVDKVKELFKGVDVPKTEAAPATQTTAE